MPPRFSRPQDESLPGIKEPPGPDVGILKTGESHKIGAESIKLAGVVGVAWRDGLARLRHDDDAIITVTNADGQTLGYAQVKLQSGGYKTHREDHGPEWLEKLWTVTKP